MRTWLASAWFLSCKFTKFGAAALVLALLSAEAAVSSASTRAAAPNLVNLQLRNQALASQVRIHVPPSNSRLQGYYFPEEPFRHLFLVRLFSGSTTDQFVVIPSGRGRPVPLRDYPKTKDPALEDCAHGGTQNAVL